MIALAEILRRHGAEYRARFENRMPLDQLRVMQAITACRTPALGGHRWHCPTCGEDRFSYHSCGNRHCPACGHDDAQLWLNRQQALLLPVTYHLCTFTVPAALRRPIRAHPREALAILFQTASSSLLDLCANPQWFGALPGVSGVLHTWTRLLEYHPHIHFLVTGGGEMPDGSWKTPSTSFLVPVHALSAVFRARFRDALRKTLPAVFATIAPETWRRDWVVHVKPVGGGEKALLYLSRYIYRVALANRHILAADSRAIRFRYRRSEDGQSRVASLTPLEFLRRFLQHVLPSRFVKVRHFGLHHPARRSTLRLMRAALYLKLKQPIPIPPPPPEPSPCLCPQCRAPMIIAQRLAPLRYTSARGPPP
ncbi:MAG: hypothetical protein A3K19_10470 [Lentisphaerae bacterium RIFOXYB12_FULL_65_16]|nr:MAG: hypothetical protein A2498_11440 [Lentisphaerae bacterium RIFOXYC12_FULL_60_16]OGV84388.1 MAG: hypothetical protein A3K19_10470 [Lentisphaerae bacterium RIFOXYB12_FULL_65_16]